jgi:phosphohistidine phosphatase
MLNLMLLRHAKSSPDEKGLADMERPLNGRGQRAAQAIGRAVANLKVRPELVLCSPARRAADTWNLAKLEVPGAIPLHSEDQLYEFGDGERVLNCLKARAGEAKSVLIVGHNPSLRELALRLIGSGDKVLRDRLENKFPTAGLAVIAFRSKSWQSIAAGSGELSRFIRPKDILADSGD